MDIFIIILVIVLAIYALILQTMLLRKSFDGQIVITQDEEGKKMFSLELDKDPDEIASMGYITFKVTDEPDEEED